jgi:hypothetical protein
VDFNPCSGWPLQFRRLTPVRVALISTRAIKAGEELLYCYTSNDGEAAFPVSRQLECHCGAIDCRGYVF